MNKRMQNRYKKNNMLTSTVSLMCYLEENEWVFNLLSWFRTTSPMGYLCPANASLVSAVNTNTTSTKSYNNPGRQTNFLRNGMNQHCEFYVSLSNMLRGSQKKAKKYSANLFRTQCKFALVWFAVDGNPQYTVWTILCSPHKCWNIPFICYAK